MSLQAALAPFEEILAAGRGIGERRVGWIGLDVPLEIIDAAGFVPLRIRAAVEAPSPAADRYGEGGGHPLMRALIGRLAEPDMEGLSHLAVGSTPVTGTWLFNLLLSLGDDGPGAGRWEVSLVDLIRNGRTSARRYNSESLRAFADRLAPGLSGADLAQACARRNRLRRRLGEVEALRIGGEPRLSGVAARTVLDAVELVGVERALDRVEALLAQAPDLPVVGGLPVVYSGTGSASLDLYPALEAQGLRIVADDQDYGTRAIGPEVDLDCDPFEALAERYRTRDPAPAGWRTAVRAAYLQGLAAGRGARAVVFELAPWEHPSGWDAPREIAALRNQGFAVAVLAPDAARSPVDAAAICAVELGLSPVTELLHV